MSKRKRIAVLATASTIALAAVPAVAGAATQDYGPGDTDWTGSRSSEGLCVPVLLCPVVTNSIEATGGAPGSGPAFIRTSLGSLTGVGATSIGTWESAPFTYQGVDGKAADSVALALSRRADVGQLLAVTGNSATYSVDVLGASPGTGSVQAISNAPLSGADSWVAVPDAAIAPGALQLGSSYRVRITTRYETGATVIPGGSADYDGVSIRATREDGGGGNGGGGNGGNGGGGNDTLAGLADSGVAGAASVNRKGSRLRVNVRCSRKLDGACRIRLVGLDRRTGPKVTAKAKTRVRSGKKRTVTLKVKRGYRGKLDGRRKLFVRQKIKADGETVTKVKKLRLRH